MTAKYTIKCWHEHGRQRWELHQNVYTKRFLFWRHHSELLSEHSTEAEALCALNRIATPHYCVATDFDAKGRQINYGY